MKSSLFLFLFVYSIAAQSLEEQFSNIYITGEWGKNEAGEGFSGGGSTPQAAKEYINFVQNFINKHNIKTVVDAGCGDWSFSYLIDWSNIQYIGYDIVKFIIDRNIQKYSAHNITFVHADITEINLPPADLLLCKDTLQHLKAPEILRFIPQLKKYRYCLITNGSTVNLEPYLSESNHRIVLQYYGNQPKTIILIEN